MPGHADEQRAIVAEVGRPPVLRGGHQRRQVLLHRGQVQLLERFTVVEVRAQRVGLDGMLAEQVQPQLLWPPLAIGRTAASGMREGTLCFVRHTFSPYGDVLHTPAAMASAVARLRVIARKLPDFDAPAPALLAGPSCNAARLVAAGCADARVRAPGVTIRARAGRSRAGLTSAAGVRTQNICTARPEENAILSIWPIDRAYSARAKCAEAGSIKRQTVRCTQPAPRPSPARARGRAAPACRCGA
ncbi:hypothetical protein D9M70_504340 [compost metagenome]